MQYGLDWICRNIATYRAPLEIFSLSSTVVLSTSSSSSSSASLSSFSSSASGLATPARTTSPPQCSDHSIDRDIGQSRSVTMMMIGNDENPFRDQKKVDIRFFSPRGSEVLFLGLDLPRDREAVDRKDLAGSFNNCSLNLPRYQAAYAEKSPKTWPGDCGAKKPCGIF